MYPKQRTLEMRRQVNIPLTREEEEQEEKKFKDSLEVWNLSLWVQADL